MVNGHSIGAEYGHSIILLVWAEYGHSMGASVSGAYWAQHVLGTSNASHRMLAGVCRLRCWVGVLAQTGDGCCTITSIHSSLAGSSSSSLPLFHAYLCIHLGTKCTFLPAYLGTLCSNLKVPNESTHIPTHLPTYPPTILSSM